MVQTIEIPYRPRPLQLKLHNSLARWSVLVCHRRFGKTVFGINQLGKTALTCPLPKPRVAYIAPTYAQAKRVAWDMCREYFDTIPGVKFNESELRVDFPNGGRLTLYGSDNVDALRGIYLDDCVLDEYANMHPRLFPEVIRPALSDRGGSAIWIGTPNGHNHFFDIRSRALIEMGQGNKDWFTVVHKASDTKILPAEELVDAAKMMTEEQYAQEFECSFEAAILGAYYAADINKLAEKGRIRSISYNSSYPVDTAWDIGVGDSTSIIFYQLLPGDDVHVLDYYENSGKGLEHYVKVLSDKEYTYGQHFGPHDLKVQEFGTGKTRLEMAHNFGIHFRVLPKLKVIEGINAARVLMKRCWFDHEKCEGLLTALRQYRQDYDSRRQVFKDKPMHDWTSNPADAFRYMAMSIDRWRDPDRVMPAVALMDYDAFA